MYSQTTYNITRQCTAATYSFANSFGFLKTSNLSYHKKVRRVYNFVIDNNRITINYIAYILSKI